MNTRAPLITSKINNIVNTPTTNPVGKVIAYEILCWCIDLRRHKNEVNKELLTTNALQKIKYILLFS